MNFMKYLILFFLPILFVNGATYYGDNSFLLLPGDKIVASNGYSIQLVGFDSTEYYVPLPNAIFNVFGPNDVLLITYPVDVTGENPSHFFEVSIYVYSFQQGGVIARAMAVPRNGGHTYTEVYPSIRYKSLFVNDAIKSSGGQGDKYKIRLTSYHLDNNYNSATFTLSEKIDGSYYSLDKITLPHRIGFEWDHSFVYVFKPDEEGTFVSYFGLYGIPESKIELGKYYTLRTFFTTNALNPDYRITGLYVSPNDQTRSALITWNTGYAMTSYIEYGPKNSDGYPYSTGNSNPVNSHSVTLTNLQPGQYKFRVKSCFLDYYSGCSYTLKRLFTISGNNPSGTVRPGGGSPLLVATVKPIELKGSETGLVNLVNEWGKWLVVALVLVGAVWWMSNRSAKRHHASRRASARRRRR
ncbi:MAG: fibronectin type III domain-containing protein [Candidatus Micrarchaeota archaeon]